jgi:hypothetical protein
LPDGSRPPVWFAFDGSRPLAFFAGIWTRGALDGSGRDDDRGALVKAAYHLDQQLAARLRERQYATLPRHRRLWYGASDFSKRSVQWPTKTT